MPGPYDDLIPDQPMRAEIRQRESGGRNLPATANYDYPHSNASSDYQIQPGTWRAWTREFGVGTNYATADKAPPGVRDAVSELAAKKYGPNASYTWAASAPRGGYPSATGKPKAGAYDDLVPKHGSYDDLLPKAAAKTPLEKAAQIPTKLPAESGPVDPSIIARQKQSAEDTGYFAPERKFAKMVTNDPTGTLKKVGVATVEEARRIGVGLKQDIEKLGGWEPPASLRSQDKSMVGPVADLAQLGMKGAPGGAASLAGKVAEELPMKVEAEPAVGAARTPLHELVAHNIKTFEEQNKGPGFRGALKATASNMRSYFDDKATAKTIISKSQGEAKRTAFQAKAAMKQFQGFANSLGMEDQLGLLNWLEDPKSRADLGRELTPEASGFVNTFRDWMQTYKRKLQSLPQAEQMSFKEDFATHLWRRPDQFLNLIHQYGAKTGSNYFAKKRVFESYAEGIHADLAPLTTDPMEIFARYVENASKKIASWETVNEAADNGLIVYRSAADNIPTGWVPLKGVETPFAKGYAPAGFAKIYNNFVSTPWKLNVPGTNVDLIDIAARASNAVTAFKLMVPGFHTTLETTESVFSGMSNAIDKTMGGHPLQGVAAFGSSIGKPFTSFAGSRMLQRGYLDGEFGNPQLQKIVQAGVDANYDFMREGGLADEYRMSKMPGFIKSWQRGRLAIEAREALKDIKQAPLTGGARQIFNGGVRAFETATEPTFQYYIPWLKNQAFYDMMNTYMQKFPDADRTTLAKYAGFASDIVDARLGEMNKDRIFWHATTKKMLSGALISYSYTLGMAKQMLGPAFDTAKLPYQVIRKVKGTLPYGEQLWTPRLSFAIATGLGVGLVDSVYQYLMTGAVPQSPGETLDMMVHGPLTGGQVMSGGKMSPERAKLPMFFNSFLNFWNSPEQEAWNKVNPLWQTIVEAIQNEDWKSNSLYNPKEPVTARLERLGQFVSDELGKPIAFGQIEGKKAGTQIGTGQSLLGVRAAGTKDINPAAVQKGMDFNSADKWYDKLKADENKRRAIAGDPPLRLSRRQRSAFVHHLMRDPKWTPWPTGYKGPQ